MTAATGPLLDCGHYAAATERFRPGLERWCSTCQQWHEEAVSPARMVAEHTGHNEHLGPDD